MDLWTIISANGPVFVIVFVAMFFFGVYLISYRCLYNWKYAPSEQGLKEFIAAVRRALVEGDSTRAQQMYDKCKSEDEKAKALARLFVTAVDYAGRGKNAMQNALIDVMRHEILPDLKRPIPWILLVARIAPMVGLFGTVFGMITAFATIAGSRDVNPQDLADSIGLALYTTAEGLALALIVLPFYQFFVGRLQQYEIRLQRAAQATIELQSEIAAKGIKTGDRSSNSQGSSNLDWP